MDWFRHYHGTATDPKLHRIARAAGCSRGLVCGAWWAVLETASQATDRGTLPKFDATTLAYLADIKPSLAGRILEGFLNEGMLTPEMRVAAWDRRQKSSDNGKIRVQRHRERLRNALNDKETESGGNVTETHRTEQNRTDKKEPPLPPPDEAPPKPRASPAEVLEAEFEELWQRYPRKVDKQAGRKAYLKARKAAPHATILAAFEVYARQCVGRDPDKIKHPASWLNAQDWQDPHVAEPPPLFAPRPTPSGPPRPDIRDIARQGVDPYAIPVRPQ